MKALLRAALPFTVMLSFAAAAVEIEAGGRAIEIPIPTGYAELTQDMSPYYEAMYAYVVPTNERYLALLPEQATEAHRRGKDAEYYRYMLVEAEIRTIRFDITQAEFDELRNSMGEQLKETYESIRQSLPGLFDDASNSISDVFDADLELSIGEVIPFEPHLNTQHAFAFSQLISMGVAVDGEDLGAEVGMVTATIVKVRDKMIFVYVYGSEDDLEWTREFSADWVDQILAANESALGSAEAPDQNRQAEAHDDGTFSLGPTSMILLVILVLMALFFVVRGLRQKGTG